EFAAANPGIAAASEALAGFEARLSEARRALLPQGTLSALVAPAPQVECRPSEALCLQTNSAEFSPTDVAGVYTRLDVKLAQPLYTFGKLSGVRRAAEAGVDVGRAQLGISQAQIAYDVHRAYHGLKLAREILFTIEEGQEYVHKVSKRIDEQLDSGKGDATETDRLRLRVFEAELEGRIVEARRGADVALAALRMLATGAPRDFDIDEAPLAPIDVSVRPLDHYLDLARRNRPEVKALDAALRARRAAEDIEWARFWPDLALVAQLAWGRAPTVDDPDNFFANDPFNTVSGGVAALLSMQLDHPLKLARYRRAEAETREMEAKRRQAFDAIDLDIKRVHAELVEARARMEATKRGEKAARSWLVSTYQNLMLGLVEPKELTDALLAFFTLRLRYLQSVYDLNTGAAALGRAIGASIR
ncbi:MAG: TolC family protein, partial [Myxococcota bacterium]